MGDISWSGDENPNRSLATPLESCGGEFMPACLNGHSLESKMASVSPFSLGFT